MFDLKRSAATYGLMAGCVAAAICGAIGLVTAMSELSKFFGGLGQALGAAALILIVFVILGTAVDWLAWKLNRKRRRAEKLSRELDEIFRNHQGGNL